MAEKSAPSCHPTLRQQDQRSWPAPCAIQIPAADLISPIRPSSSRARKKEKGGWGRCEPPLRRSGRRRGQKAAGGGSERISEEARREGARGGEAGGEQRKAGGRHSGSTPAPYHGASVPHATRRSGCAAAGRDSKRTYCTSLYHFSPNAQHYGLGPVSSRGILPVGVSRVNWIFF